MKLQKAFRYVRQRTNLNSFAYVRSRTQRVAGVCALLVLSGCASTAVAHGTPGLVTIQTAVTCPAPPAHTAVTNPPRTFTSAPKLAVPKDIGYCAFIDTAAGVISIRLRPEYAPHAVSDFVSLAQHGFYDGLSFYQACPAISGPPCPDTAPVALAGDPTNTGTGGPGYSVASDPVVGEYLFGAVAMYGSSASRIGSQFLISKGDSSSLARKYDIFGQVTNGFGALAAVQKGTPIIWIAIVMTAPEP
jgi:peptidyl-prolyl cis-trans isomerase B (cyclophilin B)